MTTLDMFQKIEDESSSFKDSVSHLAREIEMEMRERVLSKSVVGYDKEIGLRNEAHENFRSAPDSLIISLARKLSPLVVKFVDSFSLDVDSLISLSEEYADRLGTEPITLSQDQRMVLAEFASSSSKALMSSVSRLESTISFYWPMFFWTSSRGEIKAHLSRSFDAFVDRIHQDSRFFSSTFVRLALSLWFKNLEEDGVAVAVRMAGPLTKGSRNFCRDRSKSEVLVTSLERMDNGTPFNPLVVGGGVGCPHLWDVVV